MSIEAISIVDTMKLALEALEPDVYRAEWAVEEDKQKAITALRVAIASYSQAIAVAEQHKQAPQSEARGLSQQKQEALNRKADNARELGLDYEPENTLHWHALNYRTAPTQNARKMFEALEQFVKDSIRQAIEQAQKQEPVAWLGFNERGECREVFTPAMQKTFPNYPTTDMTPVYTSPPQQNQEPVAWVSILGAVSRGWCYEENANKAVDSELAVAIAKEVQALYTSLQVAEPQPQRQELQAKGEHPAPCARFCEANAFNIEIRRLKAQRQPLTDEQIRQVMQSLGWTGEAPSDIEFARAIEAAHGIMSLQDGKGEA